MARIETDPYYTAPTFSRATVATDIFKKEDVQGVAAALSTHDHTVGKGAPLTAIPSSALSVPLQIAGNIRATNEVSTGWTGVGTELAWNAAGVVRAYDRSSSGNAGYRPLQLQGSTIAFQTTDGVTSKATSIDAVGSMGVAGNISLNTAGSGAGTLGIGGPAGSQQVVIWNLDATNTLFRANTTLFQSRDGVGLGALYCGYLNATTMYATSLNATGPIHSGQSLDTSGQLILTTNGQGIQFIDSNTMIFSLNRTMYFDEFNGGWQFRNPSTSYTVVHGIDGVGHSFFKGTVSGLSHYAVNGTAAFSAQNISGHNGLAFAWVTYACVDHAKAFNLLTEPVENPISLLKTLQPYHYAHMSLARDPDKPDEGTQPVRTKDGEIEATLTYGMSAQQVQQHLPELVMDVDGEPGAIDYGRLTTVLWSACQVLEDRIAALEGKVGIEVQPA